MEGNDSIEKLLGDIDAATRAILPAETYMARACPRDEGTTHDAFCDISKRLHALMPRDIDGREIKVGDEVELVDGGERRGTRMVGHLVIAPTCTGDQGEFQTIDAQMWRVVQPDSWEMLEADMAMSACSYAGGGGDCRECRFYGSSKSCDVQKAHELVVRAMRLAGSNPEGAAL